MKIDETTMLFTEISAEDRKEMYPLAKRMILEGFIPNPIPKFITQWMETFEYTERQYLMVMATAIPQRILVSLLEEPGT